ncbi:MAG: DUF3795 domain-containing protein [Chloroflexi bacterium]|jgi:hypothetical protein|nr:DUF3795 domain-containing protein [Chloroflexota bacterium]
MTELAYCGLNCEECPVFQATQNRDEVHKRWLAAEYSSEELCLSTKDMTCYGCHSQQRLESRMCMGCQIRQCASKRPISNCAHCIEYPCLLIMRFVSTETDARAALELERAQISINA